MAKRRKTHPPRETPPPRPKAEKPAFGSPFKDLKKLLNDRPRPEPSGQPSSPALGQASAKTLAAAAAKAAAAAGILAESESEPMLDDATMFRQAVDGVRRLGDQRPVRVVPRPEVTREVVSEDAEVLAQLSDLVSGAGTFELNETEEYTEGTRLGLDPRLVTRLRRASAYRSSRKDSGRRQAGAGRICRGFGAQGIAHGAGRARTRPALAGRDAGAQACRGAVAFAWSHGRVRVGVRDRAAGRRRRWCDVRVVETRSPPGQIRRPSGGQAPRLIRADSREVCLGCQLPQSPGRRMAFISSSRSA